MMVSLRQIHLAVDTIAEERGWLTGAPLPMLDNGAELPMIARGAPLEEKGYQRVCSTRDMAIYEVNRWSVMGHEVIVCDESGTRAAVRRPHVAERLEMLLKTSSVRMQTVTAAAEVKALGALADRLSENQWQSYILNSMFAETSKRSGLTYVFRRGRPTLALRKAEEGVIFLAALCFHPLAYYPGSWAGALPPSDEVLAHLLLMRADEHRLWRKAEQHVMWDPRSGI